MNRNESQTRQQIIDQRLKLVGWDVKNPLHITEELDIWIGLSDGVRKQQSPKSDNDCRMDYHLIVYFPPGLRTNAHGRFSPRSMIEGIKRRLSPLRKAAVGLLREAVDTPLAVLDMDDAEPLDPAKLFRSLNITANTTISSDSSVMKGRLAKLRPISLGLSRERIMSAPATPLEKTVDVFFAGCVAKRLVRKKGLPYLRSLAAKGIKVEESEGLPLNEYLQRCARAWLVWYPEGLGRDCFRHYEAPLCRVVPLINRAPVIRYRPLLDGTHCFYYSEEEDDLARVILSGLSDKPRLLKMAEAGRGHVLEYHTHEAPLPVCHE
jgi:hypothetical protein